jgi:hypothetical protein
MPLLLAENYAVRLNCVYNRLITLFCCDLFNVFYWYYRSEKAILLLYEMLSRYVNLTFWVFYIMKSENYDMDVSILNLRFSIIGLLYFTQPGNLSDLLVYICVSIIDFFVILPVLSIDS